eukprot:TRINITY_DN462_c0_g1_i3.p1 TRINITY_DN462_c0_g1~~TRINITY_DN462_c0_g1_i3.p1  ORF type:complete len:757 (-),score=84.17 TRINITY_DN462_c0_g1_i3:342-2612(-)
MVYQLSWIVWTVAVTVIFLRFWFAQQQAYFYRRWRKNLSDWYTGTSQLNWWEDHEFIANIRKQIEMDKQSCAQCGKNSPTYQCSQCKCVRYCSPDCQRVNWRSHKSQCADMKRKKIKTQKQKEHAKRLENEVAPVPSQVLHPYKQFQNLWDASFNSQSQRNEEFQIPRGIENCGNSCYASAILQCLIFTPAFGKYLNEKLHSEKCPSASRYCFLCELEQFVTQEYKRKSLRGANIYRLLRALNQISKNMIYAEQQDAHEFLLCAFQNMESIFLAELGGEDQFDLRTRETTLVHHLFNGYYRQQTMYGTCGNISTTFQSFMDLQLDIPSERGQRTTLEQCLNNAYKFEWLDEGNKMKCEKCEEQERVCKGARIEVAPNILIIQLKRFAFLPNGRIYKVNTDVQFSEKLDLSKYMADDAMDTGPPSYSLYGVIEHLNNGFTSSSGHYLGYVNGGNNKWYLCNDEKVYEIDLQDVLSTKAYLLFYQRDSPRQEPDVQFVRGEGYKLQLPSVCLQSANEPEQDVDRENVPFNRQSILVQNQLSEEIASSKSSTSSQVSVPKTDGQWIADLEDSNTNINVQDMLGNKLSEKLRLDNEPTQPNEIYEDFCVPEEPDLGLMDQFQDAVPDESSLHQSSDESQTQDLNLQNLQHPILLEHYSSDEFKDVIPEYAVIEGKIQHGDSEKRVLSVVISTNEQKYDVTDVSVDNQMAIIQFQQSCILNVPLKFEVDEECVVEYSDDNQQLQVKFIESGDILEQDQDVQ